MIYYQRVSRWSQRRPAAERLEPRLLLHGRPLLAGGEGTLTLSFAPDGTSIAGMESALFSTLGALGSADQWQEAILRAFQTWAVETNATIGVVTDSGHPFGVPGEARGDSRFGDIRIGAAPLAENVYALAIPAGDVLSGTWVGDVILNSRASFASLDELFAVALHEAGHVLGLEHSEDPLSPMHVHGITPVNSLTADDILAIQSLYGTPSPDVNELAVSNDTAMSATTLKLNGGAVPDTPSISFGAITQIGDVDYFQLPLPGGFNGRITISVRTAGLSLMAPELSVYDDAGVKLGEAASARVGGDQITVTLDNVPSGGKLLIRVSGARSDVYGVGAYLLSAWFNDLNAEHQATLEAADAMLRFLPQQELAKLFQRADETDGSPYFNEDDHLDDDPAESVRLSSLAGFPVSTRYEAVGSIAELGDVDHYRVMSPGSGGSVMTIRVRSLERAGLIPRLAVFKSNGDALPMRVLINGGGEQVVQVVGVEPRTNVTLRVSAGDGSGLFADGNYQLAVGFGDQAIDPQPVFSGSVNAETPVQYHALYVAQPQLFHLSLAATGSAANSAAMLTILDASNQAVFRVSARPGETRTAGSVLLMPGTYLIHVGGVSLEPLAGQLDFTLFADVTSAPFSADPDDPTFEPEFLCDDPEHAGLYCYPGGFISADPYLWTNFIDSLEEPPVELRFYELVVALLGDWWTWVWNEVGGNGPPLALTDRFRVGTSDGTTNSLPSTAPMNVLQNDVDPEREPVVALLRSDVQHGTLTLDLDGTVHYTPNEGFVGVDSFTYVAFDFSNESAEATVRISVGYRGDYDGDSTVNGVDFLAWQREFGQLASPTGAGADGDGDGVVGAGDLFAWSDNLGSSQTETSESPETLALKPSAEVGALLSASINLSASLGVVEETLKASMTFEPPLAARSVGVQRERPLWRPSLPSSALSLLRRDALVKRAFDAVAMLERSTADAAQEAVSEDRRLHTNGMGTVGLEPTGAEGQGTGREVVDLVFAKWRGEGLWETRL